MPGVAGQYVMGGGGGINGGPGGRPLTNEECGIREVWMANLEEEFQTIRRVVQHFPYVAMDTEFPGVVARPIGEFRSNADYQYQLLRCNVDLLKIIQLGFSFFDENGKMAPGISTWQFNFKFNLTEDMYAQDSIDLLQNSGLQFNRHEEEGIPPIVFAELLMDSGIVLIDKIRFLSFHSGYDFGYLLRLLTDVYLPMEESEFFDSLRLYFPYIYDVKYLMKSCKNLKGGLQEVAEQLELERVGPQHQAGSDSLLTGAAFFKMRELFFEDKIDDQKYCGHLYGLGTIHVQNGNALAPGGLPPPVALPPNSSVQSQQQVPPAASASASVSASAPPATATSAGASSVAVNTYTNNTATTASGNGSCNSSSSSSSTSSSSSSSGSVNAVPGAGGAASVALPDNGHDDGNK